MSGAIGGDQCVLDGVGGFLSVSEGAQGDGPEPVAVATHELTEGVGITCDVGSQQFLVIHGAVFGVVVQR